MLMRILALALSLWALSPAQAGEVHYPLAGTHRPNIKVLLAEAANGGKATEGKRIAAVAKLLSRYDVVSLGDDDFEDALTLKVIRRAKKIKSHLRYNLMWAIRSNDDCASIPANEAELSTFLAGLQTADRNLINIVYLDGGGNAIKYCSEQPVRIITRKYGDLASALRAQGMPLGVIANSAVYPYNRPECGFNRNTYPWPGYSWTALSVDMGGTYREGLVSRYALPFYQSGNAKSLPRIEGHLYEPCAWANGSTYPALSMGLVKCETPWLHLPETVHVDDRCQRLGWTIAQLGGWVYVQTPGADTVLARIPYAGNVSCIDYCFIDRTTGRPPSWGADPVSALDDDATGQRRWSKWLGPAMGPLKVTHTATGVFAWRRYRCGIVVANATAQAMEFKPPITTRRILGYQDPAYDDGKAYKRYVVPAADGLALLSQEGECLDEAAKVPVQAGTWKPPVS